MKQIVDAARLVALTAVSLASATTVAMADAAPNNTVRYVYLIRHGDYGASTEHTADGPGLTPLGIAQARLLAARLQGSGEHFSLMYSSTMTRAQETGAVIHETLLDVPQLASPVLRECMPPVTHQRPPTPSEAQCQDQLNGAFSIFFKPAVGAERRDLIICHGNVIRYLVMKALGSDTTLWARLSVAHASITVIRVKSDGTMQVQSVGDIGHVPTGMQSGADNLDHELKVPSS